MTAPRLTAERLQEIRDGLDDGDIYGQYAAESISELLTELDALRAEREELGARLLGVGVGSFRPRGDGSSQCRACGFVAQGEPRLLGKVTLPPLDKPTEFELGRRPAHVPPLIVRTFGGLPAMRVIHHQDDEAPFIAARVEGSMELMHQEGYDLHTTRNVGAGPSAQSAGWWALAGNGFAWLAKP